MSDSKIKIQHVRFCRSCQELLPVKCTKCIAHPERKPRVVEIIGTPKILATAPCNCVKLQCQRDKCAGTMWRQLKADGSLPTKNHFCSGFCQNMVTAAARKTKTTITCSFVLCRKPVEKHLSALKVIQRAFCSQKCHYFQRIREKMIKRRETDDIQVLSCEKCREVRDHKKVASGLYACTRCNYRRKDLVERPELVR